VPTAGEMEKLGQIAEAYGLEPANSADGLSMLRLEGNSSPEFASQLRPGLERQVRQIVPEAKVTQGLHQGNLIDFTKDSAIAKANEGQGLATRLWEDRMRRLQDVDPVRYDRLVNSPGVKQKAAADLERLEAYGGRGDRLDYEKLLGIIEKGGLKGLLDHVARYGYEGLPVVAVGGALPVIVGKNGSPDEL